VLHSIPDFFKYWGLKKGTKEDALYKLTVAAYIRRFTEREVKTLLWMWHKKHRLQFDLQAWAENVRPNAVKKAAKYLPKAEMNRREQCNNTTKLFCRNNQTGEMDVVLFDTFQEFSVDPWTYEWIINEHGHCVSIDQKEYFPYLFRYSCAVSDVEYLDGNTLNCRRDNIDVI
jgi:hypothetical protein